jgi:hypothetical protein
MRGLLTFLAGGLASCAMAAADVVPMDISETTLVRSQPVAVASAALVRFAGAERSGWFASESGDDVWAHRALSNDVFGLTALGTARNEAQGGDDGSRFIYAVHRAMSVDYEMDLAFTDAGNADPLYGVPNGVPEPERERSVLIAPLPQGAWLGLAGLGGAWVIAWSHRRARRV